MDYAKVYIKFIDDRRAKENNLKASGEYYEKHHIKPRNMGGGDEPENMVALTAGDHYFAHLLLAFAHGGRQWMGVKAMANMPGSTKRRDFLVRRRWVDAARKKSAKIHSDHSKRLHKDPEYVKKLHSPDARKKRSATMRISRSTPQQIERQRSVMLRNYSSESFILAKNEAVKKHWSKQENRDAASKRWKENQPMNDPAVREKVRSAVVEYWSCSEARERMSAALSRVDHPVRSEAAKQKSMEKIKEKRQSNPELWIKVPVVVGGVTMGLKEAGVLLGTTDSNIRKIANSRGATVQEICDWYAATTKDERMTSRAPRSGFVTYDGKSWTKKELCKKYSLSYWTVLDRAQRSCKEWIEVFSQMADQCHATA